MHCSFSGVMIASMLAGCTRTVALSPHILQLAQGETPAPTPSDRLSSDYSLQQPRPFPSLRSVL
jgi:hypothetical protein